MKTEEILQENRVADVATPAETPPGEAAEAPEEGAAVEAETAPPVSEAPAETAPLPAAETPSVSEAPLPEEPAAARGVPAEEVERLVAEAYRRGRNESIAELMARPGMFEAPAAPPEARISSADSGFLANRRPSIWDR